MNLRFYTTAAFALLLTGTFLMTEAPAQPNTIKKIVEGVWFREGDLQKGHCNNAIIEMKDYLIVIDANYPSGARLTMADAKKLSTKPVKYVFDTHHHGDHLYGNAVWTASGATTLAFQGVADELKRYEPGRWKDTGRPDVDQLKLATAEVPKQLIPAATTFKLNDGTREVQFLQFGWAHTKGDGLAWLPKERVLCSGDAATNGPYNYTADGNITNWPSVMAGAMKLDPQFVLPGHGPSGGKEILSGQAAFMTELRAAVAKEVAAGKKISDLVVTKNGKTTTTIQLSPAVKNWVGGSLVAQVKDAFTEVTTGKAVGELPHP